MPEEEANIKIGEKAPLTCPHCSAGEDGLTLGLYWDNAEDAWRCVQCGHRSYEQKIKSPEEIMEDLKWEMIVESFENESVSNHYVFEENEFEEEALKISQSP